MSQTQIDRAQRYIAKCPPAISGQDGHDATFHVASVLWNGFALSEGDTLVVLREWNQRCVPPWSEAELLHKVKSAAGAQHRDARGHFLGGGLQPAASRSCIPAAGIRPAKPEFRPMVLKRVAAKAALAGGAVEFVMSRSPVVVETQDSASFLRRLYQFGSGEKVLIFSKMKTQGQLLWEANRSDVIQNPDLPTGPDGVWFLPQPVDGQYHPNPRSERRTPSRRSEESVTSWRYMVLESDEADPEDWLRCLIQMPLPIASICESGGRSIHALVRVDAADKPDWDRKVQAIKPILITLGADPGALSAVRLTRLPQAQRGERVQRLLYLNATPTAEPMLLKGGAR